MVPSTATRGSFFIPLAVAGIISILGAASYLFIVGEIAPTRPLDDDRMPLPESVKAVA
jgi:ACS family D-galactonate transporter-like MFS transporter